MRLVDARGSWAAFTLTVALAACGGDRATGPDPSSTRGQLVSATLAATTSAAAIAPLIQLAGVSAAFTARYDVQMYSIRYRTIDVAGRETIASGAVFVPVAPTSAAPLMSYSHGTVASRNAVPSNPTTTEGPGIGALFATGGAVVAMADYLGLGAGTGFHPYIHAASAASAGLDALRAARKVAEQQKVALNGKLFVFGYSQGGHAAMALAREIETRASNELTLTAAAPMSGPYDVYGTARIFLADTVPNRDASAYAIAALATYDTVYHLGSLTTLFTPPYDDLARRYLAGQIGDELQTSLAPTPRAMMQATAVAALDDPNSAITKALHDNDVHDWRPRAPIRLYYGSADRNVPPQNAITAAARMTALGANVTAVNLGPLTHGGAVIPALMAAGVWFRTF